MKNIRFALLSAASLALLAAGCAGPENKIGRGSTEIFQAAGMDDMRRSIEQTAIFESPSIAYTTGVARGFDAEMTRLGVGIAEVATFPFPPYAPYMKSLGDYPGPESYRPGRYSDALFDTDTYNGFSGGEVAPFVPGSRFKIFDN